MTVVYDANRNFEIMEEQVSDMAWKVTRMIIKDHTEDEAEKLFDLFVEEVIAAQKYYAEKYW